MTARRAWAEGRWTHPPVSSAADGDDLVVEAVAQSDAWRITSYGFVHDTEHALVAELGASEAVEVVFGCDFTAQFDQAGVFVRVDDETWVKAGVEFADGVPQVGRGHPRCVGLVGRPRPRVAGAAGTRPRVPAR